MTAPTQLDSTYDATPEGALAAIGEHDGLILVDLDETLYLGNSTEDFINLARPALLALLLLRVLDFVRPWRWTGGDATRDTWRVRLIWTLLPWTRRLWRQSVESLAGRLTNRQLAQALLCRRSETIVVTSGFEPIVRPLISALGFGHLPVVAPRLTAFADRRNGKLHLAVSAVGLESIATSLVITDSPDDVPLLDVCARPLLTRWPEAKFRHALSSVYFPGEYLTRVKHPGERYIARVILSEELPLWVLSSIALALHPGLHVLGMTLLLASFWCIYERGYADNDWVAAHLEDDGKLSSGFWESPVPTPALSPWIWAAIVALPAIYLLRGPRTPAGFGVPFAVWMAVLAATYGVFKLYNRVDKASRVWLYSCLQVLRSAAFVAIVPINLAAAMAIGAHVLARWIPYYLYRLRGGPWPELHLRLARLLFFVILAGLGILAQGLPAFANLTAALLLLWNLIRARSDLTAVVSGVRRLDRGRQSIAS